MAPMKSITIYTDGACLGNPGPGGYGAVLLYGESRKEISGGYRRTTNNRMELMAAIRGLAALKEPCQVRLVSDSAYLVNAIEKGWARRWQTNGWRRADKKPAENRDLWEAILALCDTHQVRFEWIKGHAGHPENECCDRLAVFAAQSPELPVDVGYENSAPAAR